MSLSNPTNPPILNEHVATRVSSGLVFAVDENQTKVNQIHGINPVGSTGSGIPKAVSNVAASISNASVGTTSTISVRFQRDPLDKNFAKIVIYAKGYQGNNTPVQVGSSADSPATVVLNNTGESVSLIVQAVGNGGVSPLASSPTTAIKLPTGTNGGFGTGTQTNLTTAQVGSATTSVESDFPDPTKCFFGRTNVDLLGNGIQSGDPQVIYDSANVQWVMFWYQFAAGVVSTWKAVSSSLEGPWSGATQIATLNNYHKFRLLRDVNGAPVTIGGLYYGYAVFYNSGTGNTSKEIYLFSNSAIQTNGWTLLNGSAPVITKAGAGGAGVYDDFCTDQPDPVYDATTGNIYVWYSAFPGTSQSDFGFSPRVRVAIAQSVTGTYNKVPGYVLGPSTVGGTWDFGYVEGTQLMKQADGTYFIAYIGGSTRPGSAGDEPTTTLWGFATAPTLTGAWTKIAGPFIQLSNLPQWPTGVPNSGSVGTIVDSTNIWRPWAVLDPITNKWYVFYNTGNGASPVERVTFARQGILSFSNGAFVGGGSIPSPNNGYILILTASELQIPGSKVFLRPGRYRVRYEVQEGDVAGGTPKVTGALFIRPNGTKAGPWSQSFFGSYAFEQDDFCVDDIINVAFPAGATDASQFVDASLQITSGTPTADTFARNLRVTVEQL